MSAASTQGAEGPAAVRHVVWVLCDELRADALSCSGVAPPDVRTPNLDRLAATGEWFSEAWTVSPVCVPARTAMLLGRAPWETGVLGNEAVAPGYPLPDGLVSFPEILAGHGWRTVSHGKEHVPAALRPWQQSDGAGSDMRELVEGVREAGGRLVRTPGLGFVVGGSWPAERPFPPEGVTDRVVAQIEALGRTPTLVRASYLQPHTPVVVPEPWASRYAGTAFPAGPRWTATTSAFEARFAEVNAGVEATEADFLAAQRAYHGAVAWVDDQVGRILDALDRCGRRDDTLVVLTADHGAHLGEDGAYGKHTFAPASHRVPLIVRDPGRTVPGRRRQDLASNLDLARTVLGSCGVPAPGAIGGRDLLADPAPDAVMSLIGHGSPESRAFPNLGAGRGPGGRGWPQRACIRTGRYRLDVTTRVDGRVPDRSEADPFLVDRTTDPDERVDRSREPGYAPVLDALWTTIERTLEQSVQPSDAEVHRLFTPPAARGAS